VYPGVVDTPNLTEESGTDEGGKGLDEMHPIGRMGKPMDVAYAILYLATEEASW